MKMLYLYRGWNSDTNQVVLNAWSKRSSQVQINLMRWSGRFVDAIKRSSWCMNTAVMDRNKKKN